MVDPNDGAPPESRPPQLADLLSLCRSLNREAVRYVVVGGMAMIQAGFVRATEDIDLLVDADRTNLDRLRTALLDLPDQAVREMGEDDLDRYVVVRVADEFVVDLLKAACGVEYEEASALIEEVEIEGVRIPFASPELLWRTKQTVRSKDELDRLFLSTLLESGRNARAAPAT